MKPGHPVPTMGEWVQYLQETLSTELSLVIIAAGFLGLFFGWLIGRPWGTKSASAQKDKEEPSDGSVELNWRHEKLVLLERQEVERELRLQHFLEGFSVSHGGTETEVRSRFFALAEGLRSMRARVGTDLSRLVLASERIDELKQSGAPRPEALEACQEMAGGQVERLRELRDALRPVNEAIGDIERDLDNPQYSVRKERESLLERLEKIRADLESSNASLSVLANETDRGIRDLLGAGQEPVFDPLRNILLVDGSNTGSLERSPSESLNDELSALILALRSLEIDAVDEVKVEAPSGPEEREVEPTRPVEPVIPTPLIFPGVDNEEGDSDSRAQVDETQEVESLEEETNAEEHDNLILFRSNNAELWGRDIYRGANCRARSVEQLPGWAQWISIRRVDTGERVFSRIDQEMYEHGGNGDAIGFNASNELFYGARHLGMFSEACPNEVETRFTYGGWGFGHRVSNPEAANDTSQASGWEGKEIPADTIFEIELFADLPELDETDRVLEG